MSIFIYRLKSDKQLLKMKLTSLFFFTFLCNSLLLSSGLNSITSPDGELVIAAGNDGVVYRSTNGGSNWQKFVIQNVDFTSTTSFSTKYWLASSNGCIYIGDKFDLGSLKRIVVNLNESFNSILFLSESVGWLAGTNGYLYQSTDGGYTWNLSNSGIGKVNLNSVHVNNDGYNAAVVGDSGIFYYSFNGGASWIPENTNTNVNLNSVLNLGSAIFITGDSGKIFTKPQFAPLQEIDSKTWWDINTVHGIDEFNIKIAGGGGFIRNFNGVDFNNFEQNPMLGEISSIFVYNQNVSFAISNKNDAILKTINNGTSWSFVNVSNSNYTWSTVLNQSGGIGNGLCMHPENRNVIFLAQGNKIYRSSDLGESWYQISTVSEGTYAHGFFVNANDTNYWVASMDANNGKIMRTSNYGVTWERIWGPAILTETGNSLQMDINNNDHLFLAPDNSTLLKSTNFGSDWFPVSSHIFSSPSDIELKWNDSEIIYVGDKNPGRFFRSTNGGLNFQLTNNSSTSDVPMIGISRFNNDLVFHTFSPGSGAWMSVNSGADFSLSMNLNSAWSCAISSDDPTIFFIVTKDGAGNISFDRGNNYTAVSNIGSENSAIFIPNRETYLAQGTGGVYKLRPSYTIAATNVVVSDIQANAGNTIPGDFNLSQNFPNPFNPATSIKFSIPSKEFVTLKVYDVNGRKVETIINQNLLPGIYEVNFDGTNLSSGVYFYRISAGKFNQTRRMILVK